MINTANGVETGAIKTADATQTLFWFRTLPLGSFMRLRFTVVAVKSDGSTGAGFTRQAYAYNLNGTVTLGAISTPFADVNASGYAITFQASGTDIQVLVTGIAATTIQWRLSMDIDQA